jgi:phosphatidate cytidylyltransferase
VSELVAAPDSRAPAPPKADSLGARFLMAVCFLPALWIVTWQGGAYFMLTIALMVFFGSRELYGMLEASGLRPSSIAGMGCALGLVFYAWFRDGVYLDLVLALSVLLLMVLELRHRTVEDAAKHIGTTILALLYVGWFGSHFVLLREMPRLSGMDYSFGADFVFLAVVYAWGSDTGAYVIGKAIGKRPLLARVSPKKSIEGALGGLFFAALGGYIAHLTFAGEFLGPVTAVVLGVVVATVGQFGDMVESLLKRDLAFKDSAAILPGHGGVLDRFDSLFFAVPVTYYALKFFLI